MIEKVKVTKDGITKEILKKDLPLYVTMGWKEVKSFEIPQKFTTIK